MGLEHFIHLLMLAILFGYPRGTVVSKIGTKLLCALPKILNASFSPIQLVSLDIFRLSIMFSSLAMSIRHYCRPLG